MMKVNKISKTTIMITVLLACIMIIACFTTACMKVEGRPTVEKQNSEANQNDEVVEPVPTATPVVDDNSAIADESVTLEDDMVQKAKQVFEDLDIAPVDKVSYESSTKYFDDEILRFRLNQHDGFSLLASDLSLVGYETKELDLSIPIQLSDDEMIEIVKEYVHKIWNADEIVILNHEVWRPFPDVEEYLIFLVKGTMGTDGRFFNLGLNGKGILNHITSSPKDVNWEAGVSMDEAKEIAITFILEDTHIKDDSNLVMTSGYLNEEYSPMYIFKYEYRSDNPTADNFGFDYDIRVLASNGELAGWGAHPILDNIDVIQMDDAIQMAKEHIAENTKHKDLSKYILTHSQADSINGEIMFSFFFDYGDEYSYSLMMTGSGEFWDISGSAKSN
ncbi:MAG: hypothetical protein KAQ68_09465 [Clostridiales bacterium]|nr:hypothetical protein [Clostridiales bacterium]